MPQYIFTSAQWTRNTLPRIAASPCWSHLCVGRPPHRYAARLFGKYSSVTTINGNGDALGYLKSKTNRFALSCLRRHFPRPCLPGDTASFAARVEPSHAIVASINALEAYSFPCTRSMAGVAFADIGTPGGTPAASVFRRTGAGRRCPRAWLVTDHRDARSRRGTMVVTVATAVNAYGDMPGSRTQHCRARRARHGPSCSPTAQPRRSASRRASAPPSAMPVLSPAIDVPGDAASRLFREAWCGSGRSTATYSEGSVSTARRCRRQLGCQPRKSCARVAVLGRYDAT